MRIPRFQWAVPVLLMSVAAAAQNAETTQPADVYAGPDDSYPVVAQLDVDMPVQIKGCLNDWSWCDVAFADNRGWVYAPNLSYDYQGGYVPFYTYAPSFGIPVVTYSVGDYWDHYYRGRPWYAQRAEWIHRPLPQHHRPSGPPPSAGPPPRSARADRPVHEDRGSAGRGAPEHQGDRPIRLGSAPEQHAPAPEGRSGRAEPAPRVNQHEPASGERAPRAEGQRHEGTAEAPHLAAPEPAAREHTAPEHSARERTAPERAAPARGEPREHSGENPH